MKLVEQMGHNVSVASVLRIKHDKAATRNNEHKNGKNETFTKRRTAATLAIVSKIRNIIKLVNPSTQREMAAKFGVSLGTENRIIAKMLKVKLRKKCNVHRLSEAQVLERRLYLRLNCRKWKNVVTADEALFYTEGRTFAIFVLMGQT